MRIRITKAEDDQRTAIVEKTLREEGKTRVVPLQPRKEFGVAIREAVLAVAQWLQPALEND